MWYVARRLLCGGLLLALGCSNLPGDEAPSSSAGAPTSGGLGNEGGAAGGPFSEGGTLSDSPYDPVVVFDGTGTWLRGEDNGFGLQGAFFILEDSVAEGRPSEDTYVHSDLTADSGADETQAPLSSFSDESRKPCVSGTIARVPADDGGQCGPSGDFCAWDEVWGGGIGLNLRESGGEGSSPEPWNAAANSVRGFRFTLLGDVGGARLRFKVLDLSQQGEEFCTRLGGVGETTVLLEDLQHDCFGPDGYLVVDDKRLLQLHWQIEADQGSTHEVREFCLARLEVLVETFD